VGGHTVTETGYEWPTEFKVDGKNFRECDPKLIKKLAQLLWDNEYEEMPAGSFKESKSPRRRLGESKKNRRRV